MPLLWLSLAFISGIYLAKLVSLPVLVWVGLGLFALALNFPLHRIRVAKWNSPPLLLVLTALFVGGLRNQVAQPNITPFHIAWYNDREYEILVTGMIAEPPDVRDKYTNLKIEVH